MCFNIMAWPHNDWGGGNEKFHTLKRHQQNLSTHWKGGSMKCFTIRDNTLMYYCDGDSREKAGNTWSGIGDK